MAEPILAENVKSTRKIPPSQYEDLDFIREKMIERIALLKESNQSFYLKGNNRYLL